MQSQGHFTNVSQFPSQAPGASNPLSTAPVAMNMDALDLESLEMPKKKSKLGIFAAAAIVLGAGGFTVMNLGESGAKEAAAPAAAAAGPAEKPVSKDDPNAPLKMGKGYEVSEVEKAAFAKEAEKDKELRDKMAQALTGPNGEKADTSGEEKAAAAKGAMKAKYSGGSKKSAAPKKSSNSGGALPKGGGSSFDPLNGDIP